MSHGRRGAGAPGRDMAKAALLASTMLVSAQGALAEEQAAGPGSTTGLEEIVVTAEKHSENLQNVPISVQALGENKLTDMNVQSFDDYSKLLPSVSYQTVNPGQTEIYMRGISSGGDGNHSGPQPTVGVYVDEIPTTTILGQLDFHIYDVQRVEALSGPQGTLYGASSESGTLKIVTNKPNPSGFSAGYDLEVNGVEHGGVGGIAEGFVNIPIGDNAAVRIVGYQEHDAGYIDNVYGTRTYPSAPDIVVNNRSAVQNDYNTVQTYGGRLEFLINLDDNWTILPAIMGQDQQIDGINAFDPSIGDLEVRHFYPETDHDSWFMPSLTVTGKIGDFDLTYAGGYLQHDVITQADYTDYSYFYDVCCGYGAYETGPGGKKINIGQQLLGNDHFEKISQELRFASPQEDQFRVMGGVYYERQLHDILQEYVIPGLDPALAVTGWPNVWWLTDQERIDRDYAVFGNFAYDVSPHLTVEGGLRFYRYDNTLQGFFGFGGSDFSSNDGEAICYKFSSFRGAPCWNLNKEQAANGVLYKATVTYKIDPDKLVYFTASDGYRPGGPNRNGNFAPYQADKLYNFEVGWKTSWFDNTLRWNGDLFYDPWDDPQFIFLGANGLPDIVNAGSALSEGIETDLSWKVTPHFTLSGSASFIDARLTDVFCGTTDPLTGQPVTSCPASTAQSPNGTQLPVTPYFKGNLTGRYDWEITDDSAAYFQTTVNYTGGKWPDLRQSLAGIDPRELIGWEPSFFEVDLSGGYSWGNSTVSLYIQNALDERGQLSRYAECTANICGSEPYIVPIKPLTVGLRFGQKF